MLNKHPKYFICDCGLKWDEILEPNKRKAVCPECGLKHWPIPSVTTIIKNQLAWNKQTLLNWYCKIFREGKDPENVRDTAGFTGTLCHEYIEAFSQNREIDKNLLTLASMDDIIIAEEGLKQYKKLLDENNFTVTHTEVPLFSTKHRFGGRMDCGINNTILGDIKTSSGVYPDHVIQLAAYDYMLREMDIMHPDRWLIFHISKDISVPEDKIIQKIEIPKEMLEEGWKIFETLLWLNGQQKTFKFKKEKKVKK